MTIKPIIITTHGTTIATINPVENLLLLFFISVLIESVLFIVSLISVISILSMGL